MNSVPAESVLSDDPLWYKDAVIYQLHVKAFCDGNDDGVGDFAGLRTRLDYLQDLGVNTIWLLPFYPSPFRDDGYDISDYRDVHPGYGTLKDFRSFVREAHRRGLRVITELVINHTSDQHPWFQAARRARPGSPARDMYVWSNSDKKFPETRIIFTDSEGSNWAWDPVASAYYWHRFFSHQPDLNHNNPRVVKAVTSVMRFWMDMGVDGLRLDAIPYLCVREGTANENLPETHVVIKRMRAVIDKHYRNRMFLAEANQWPEDVREYFGDGDECHMAYHFPLMPRIYMAVALEDRYPIAEILRQTPEIPDNCQWAIFLRNHDELTLEMVTDSERDYMYRMYAQEPFMRVNVGIRRRLAPLLENDTSRIKLLNSLLLSMPGSPIIYYGDEIGMGDNVFLGDRDAVRTPMQWNIDRNAGFSKADPQRLYLPVIMDPIYGYQAVNVESQAREPSSLLNWMKRMLAIRREHRSFGRGTLEFVRPANRKILAYLRSFGDEAILCVANLAQTTQACELDLSAYRGRVPVELIGRNPLPPIGNLPYLLTLQGHGVYWLHLSETASAPEWHVERLATAELPVLVLTGGAGTFIETTRAEPERKVARRATTQLETEVLQEFMRPRRWFAGKGGAIRATRLGARTLWRTGRGQWLLSLCDVQFGDDSAQTYFLPLGIAWEDAGDQAALRGASWSLAKVRERARAGVLVDAFADPAFCLALADALAAGGEVPLESGVLRFERTAAWATLAAGGLEPVQHPGAEQSNTSVRLSESLILKGYRLLRPGINPEIEMGRFLTEQAELGCTAPLAGVVDYVPAQGEPVTLVSVFGFVGNQGDGWAYTLGHLERFATSILTQAAEASPHALYLAQIRTLGRRVGELHAVLAGKAARRHKAFRPEPVRPGDVRAWGRDVRREAELTLRMLRTRLASLPETVRDEVRTLLGMRKILLDTVHKLTSDPVQALKTRLHGDLHLGQVLLVADDFLIIDFEGEPGRTFEERRRKHSALRDIAGMLRSFDYARAAGLDRAVERQPDARDALTSAFEEWRRSTAESFLSGYGDGTAGSPCRLEDAGEAERLIALFELEKALYELRYEIENRPAWVGIPIAGLRRILEQP